MRHGLSIRIVLIAALGSVAGVLCIASGSNGGSAIADGNQNGESDKKYVSSVSGYVGMLEPYVGYRSQVAYLEAANTDSLKVRFTGFLPYPNPHSSPLPVVVVGNTTDLCVRISGIGGDEDYLFDFRGVEKEIYHFWLSGPIGDAKLCTMTVEVNGGMVGSVMLPTKELITSAK